MENAKDYAHRIVLFLNGIILAYVGMDIKPQEIHVFRYVQMENYQIAKENVDQHVHGIIIINRMFKLVFLAQETLFIIKIPISVFV